DGSVVSLSLIIAPEFRLVLTARTTIIDGVFGRWLTASVVLSVLLLSTENCCNYPVSIPRQADRKAETLVAVVLGIVGLKAWGSVSPLISKHFAAIWPRSTGPASRVASPGAYPLATS